MGRTMVRLVKKENAATAAAKISTMASTTNPVRPINRRDSVPRAAGSV